MGRHNTVGLALLGIAFSTGVVTANALAGPSLIGGDLIVLTQNAADSGSLFQVDPKTGASSPIVPTLSVGFRSDLAFAPDGGIYVTNPTSLLRVDPSTGDTTAISSGGSLTDVSGITVTSAGRVFVSDRSGSVIEINPTTGAQSTVSSGGDLPDARAIVASSGELAVATGGSFDPAGLGHLILVDPLAGAQKLVGGFFDAPRALSTDSAGNLLLADVDQSGSGVIGQLDSSANEIQLVKEQADLITDVVGSNKQIFYTTSSGVSELVGGQGNSITLFDTGTPVALAVVPGSTGGGGGQDQGGGSAVPLPSGVWTALLSMPIVLWTRRRQHSSLAIKRA